MASTDWIAPLSVSACVSIAVVPVLKLVAHNTGFLDHPGPKKAHARATPYLGGGAICLGVIVAVLVARTTLHSGVIGLAASGLFVVGLVDDRRGVPPLLKLGIQCACAVVIFVIGYQLHATDFWLRMTPSRALDLVPTLALFVLIPNSVNLLDNTDGCAASVVAASASGILGLAVVNSQGELSVGAAAVTGALLGFLVFNRSPASIFMGDAGSLPLGLLIANMAVRAGSNLAAPSGAVVSLCFLGVPLADTATVLVARLTHGRSIFHGGQDHLSHRLTYVTGMSIGWATWLLIVAQAACGGIGMAVSVGAIPAWAGVVLALGVLGAVVLPAGRPAISRIIYRTVPLPLSQRRRVASNRSPTESTAAS